MKFSHYLLRGKKMSHSKVSRLDLLTIWRARYGLWAKRIRQACSVTLRISHLRRFRMLWLSPWLLSQASWISQRESSSHIRFRKQIGETRLRTEITRLWAVQMISFLFRWAMRVRIQGTLISLWTCMVDDNLMRMKSCSISWLSRITWAREEVLYLTSLRWRRVIQQGKSEKRSIIQSILWLFWKYPRLRNHRWEDNDKMTWWS